jgi:hypothetical protein
MVIVNLSLASICFLGSCHNALIGADTPTGEFTLKHMATTQPGYGGDVLVFKQTPEYAWAIHRVWTLIPSQHRKARLASNNVAYRHITMGCINVEPKVYEELVSCCSFSRLKIVR